MRFLATATSVIGLVDNEKLEKLPCVDSMSTMPFAQPATIRGSASKAIVVTAEVSRPRTCQLDTLVERRHLPTQPSAVPMARCAPSWLIAKDVTDHPAGGVIRSIGEVGSSWSSVLNSTRSPALSSDRASPSGVTAQSLLRCFVLCSTVYVRRGLNSMTTPLVVTARADR